MRTILSLPPANRSYLPIPRRARRIDWLRLPNNACLLVIEVLREWRRRGRDRAQLALLDDRMLRDIGVSRSEVLAEVNKPFWRK